MAKQVHSVAFKNAWVDYGDNELIEHLKEQEITHTLSKIFEQFKGQHIDIVIKVSSDDVVYNSEE